MNENIDPNTALFNDEVEDRGRNRSRDQSDSDVMPRDLGDVMSALRKPSQSYTFPSNPTSTSKDRMMLEGESSIDLHVTRQNRSNRTQNLDSESGIETKLNSSISMSARVRKGYVEEGGALFSWDTAYRSLSTDPIRRRARSAHPQSSIQSTVTRPDPLPSSSSSSVATAATAVVVVRGAVREKKNGVRPVRCRGASALPTSSSKARVTAAEASMSSGYQTRRPSRSHSPHHRPHRATASTVCNVLEGLASVGGGRATSTVRRVDFIPGGCTDGKEFNTYANSSKIAKAAHYHNAALTTRLECYNMHCRHCQTTRKLINTPILFLHVNQDPYIIYLPP